MVHSILDAANFFNFEKLKNSPSVNYFFGQSRVLLCNPKTYQIFSTVSYEDNSYTRSLQILKLDFKGQNNDFVEARSFSMKHEDGIWTIVDDESPKTVPTAINNNDVFKMADQVIKIQIYNPSDVAQMDKNYMSLYKQVFHEYDFSEIDQFNFTQKFAEMAIPNQGDTSVRVSALSIGGNGAACRICLEPERPSKPFVKHICKCSDSMPVHGECLLGWIKATCKPTAHKTYHYYDLKHIACDVCKEMYPPFLNVNDEKLPLLTIEAKRTTPFAVIQIFTVNAPDVKHLIILDLNKKTEERYTMGRNSSCSIQFKNELLSDVHTSLLVRGGKPYIFNNDKRFGTLKKLDGRVRLDLLHKKVLIGGKFSFLFHVFSREPCDCIKKNLKSIKGDPIDNDPKLHERDFDSIKKELKSFSKKTPIMIQKMSNNGVMNSADLNNAEALIRSNVRDSGMERSYSNNRRTNNLISNHYSSEANKKVKDDSIRDVTRGVDRRKKGNLETIEEVPKTITDREFEEIQERKSKRMKKAKNLDNDFRPDYVIGNSELPKPSIGTSELYFTSNIQFRFD